ncbi:HD-GYP domain-containing protein [Ideonella sp. DXS29W]|uniref:HD-GYP domain-containing protein n=1 Tax=Ideonella lacteola TaxID=2984193 RepID=A0ABU9BYT0_9BURK
MSKPGIKIKATELRVGMRIQRLGGSWMQHPFLRGRFILEDPADIQRIIDAGIQEVWISDGGDTTMNATLDDDALGMEAADVLAPPMVAEPVAAPPPAVAPAVARPKPARSMELDVERARKVCHNARDQVANMFQQARLGKAIDTQATLPLVDAIQAEVQRNASAILSVARLKAHDDYTYMHSVAVCALMLALARQLNLDEEQTRLAGIGGLTHDLGKMFVPLEILNKPARLSNEEFEVMKLHPAAGAKALADSQATPAAIDIALHHHEKVNGRGYPHALKGDEISLLARMGAVCDVYDAVTSIRAYKKPWDPAMSIREMARWDGDFDKRVFNAFVKSVGIYPVGSLVKLASNRLAVVVEQGGDSLLHPKVRVFFSLRSNEPIQANTLDLAAPGCKDSIVGPEDPERWGFKNLELLWQ